ncbi:MAG: zinc ribbon domain-containing protein [Oscillospiraceae bacterium]|nr:zinc ribbon domain-containing protein [Oscillospiraceae bacterium]
MKSDWLIFVGLIVVVAIVMWIVGSIGNKAVDSAANAMRSKRVQKQRQQTPQQTQSLAARYQQPQGLQTAVPAAQPAPAAKARFCMRCGQALPEGAKFCVHCGTKEGEC